MTNINNKTIYNTCKLNYFLPMEMTVGCQLCLNLQGKVSSYQTVLPVIYLIASCQSIAATPIVIINYVVDLGTLPPPTVY